MRRVCDAFGLEGRESGALRGPTLSSPAAALVRRAGKEACARIRAYAPCPADSARALHARRAKWGARRGFWLLGGKG